MKKPSKRSLMGAIISIVVCFVTGVGQTDARVEKHVVVYKEAGRFAGWPANHGGWSWGNELLVGFETGFHKKKDSGHAVDWDKPAKHVLARSMDGGETWTIEEPQSLKPPRGTRTSPKVMGKDRDMMESPGGVNFHRRDFIMTARWASVEGGESRFYYSYDRGKNWMGPYRIPMFGQSGTAARTDYLINGRHDLTMLLTVDKSNGEEGRVICVRTRDGAKTWQTQSFVGPEPEEGEFAIMPSSVRLAGGRILTAIRYGSGYIDLYGSDDEGRSWSRLSQPASQIGDNPPSMLLLKDGRLVITYGYRREPYGIRARISSDEGKTWGKEIVLRDDGGNEDLGYPRTLLRPDGKLVTIYYYNVNNSERFIGATIWSPGTRAQTGVVDKHVIVYKESGRFAGWPANHGAWSWGDELLVGFDVGHFRKALKDHAIDYHKPAKNHVLARSLDGGESWTIEEPETLKPPRGIKVAEIPVEGGDHLLTECPGGIDFTHPDFALTARMTSVDAGQSRFYYSLDRGKNWRGPYQVPNFDQPGTAARTDYLINGKHDLTLFITAAKSNGKEGRVIAVRTRDGGKTWQFQSFIGPEPEGKQWAIMPSTVRLAGGRIITAIRNSGGSIDVFVSDDEGKSWRIFSTPASGIGGSPPSMVLLKDGRVVITYGYRVQPYGIRARISADGGKTWGEEIVLRADGGNWDLGYPRTFVRSDGKLVTVYYYNLHPGRERFIGATIWIPPIPEKIESKHQKPDGQNLILGNFQLENEHANSHRTNC